MLNSLTDYLVSKTKPVFPNADSVVELRKLNQFESNLIVQSNQKMDENL